MILSVLKKVIWLPVILFILYGFYQYAHSHVGGHGNEKIPFFKPSQETSLDWKIHDVGRIRQIITNTGGMNAASQPYDNIHNYPGLFNCEYPVGSQEEHLFEAGIQIGTIAGSDTLVSITNWLSQHLNYEFYPTDAPWDTVWVIQKGDTVDIPYWPGYTAISDQDLVCRYNDYHITNITKHAPLYVEIIQTSHAWSSFPLDEVVVYNFYIIPVQNDLENAYVSYMAQGRVGNLASGQEATDDDDISVYYAGHNMAAIYDLPGGADGTAISPVAYKMYPPEGFEDQINWSFSWYDHHHAAPMTDHNTYLQNMASHRIQANQVVGGQSLFALSFGPVDLTVGDTLHFSMVQILGDGEDNVLKTAERMDVLVQQDFKVPTAPPEPSFQVETRSHEVILKWSPTAGNNPELYTDPYRGDDVEHPFEGYRIYKSTQSAQGPWTLLAEFDIRDNNIGFNTGLQHEFTDIGLLDNFEYFYSVTAFSREDTVLNFPSLESSINRNAILAIPGPVPPPSIGQVAVVPNPYRGDIAYHSFDPPWEKTPPGRSWLEQDRRIQFINLPVSCEIKIYTLSGDLVYTITHNDPRKGFEDWNLTSSVGQAISSGVYLFSVEDLRNGEVQVGKFVVIK